MTDHQLGLRERKRRATSRAIQIAVVDLVAERGIDHVTVDDISRVADISPRTFFNYFPTKEAALVGEPPALPAAELVENFVTAGVGEPVLRGLAIMLEESVDPSGQDFELVSKRKALLKEHPALLSMRMATMRQFDDELLAVVTRRLAHDSPTKAADDPELASAARLITLVAFAAMRHAWASWADAATATSLVARLRSSFDELEALFTVRGNDTTGTK
jgi:AcrR family transcriptional regulator